MLQKCLLEHRGLKAASNGSWDRHLELASFGWLLLGNGNVIVHGAGPVDEIADAMSSTRAELVRFGSLIEFLYHFQKYNKIRESQSRLMMWIDNKAALQWINRTRRAGSKKRQMCHDADIIVHTKERLDEMMMKIQLHWVKSHQDKSVPYEELGMAGRMNVDANRIAEAFRLRMQSGEETSLDGGAWTSGMEMCLIIEGKRVQSHYAHRI